MHVAKMDVYGNSNIGLFGFANDSFCLVGNVFRKKEIKILKDVLKVPIIKTTLVGTSLIGIFSVGNSNGILIPKNSYEEEIKVLEKKLNVLVLETKFTALGNLILTNDNGCIISKKLKKEKETIENFLRVRVEIGEIAGLDLVGSLGIANNKGCLVHSKATKEEIKLIEKILKVPVKPGVVNFGSPWVSSGIITNSNGFVVGNLTTGPEIGNIDEALGFL